MAKHKVSELSGALLDAAVARAQGFEFVIENRQTTAGTEAACWLVINGKPYFGNLPYSPSTNWASGGGILEEELLTVGPTHGRAVPPRTVADVWRATAWLQPGDIMVLGEGPTPLIAAMRAYVASKFGEEVELP